MAYVITRLCTGDCVDGACVDACPVDCILPAPPTESNHRHFRGSSGIDPDICIGCGA